MWKLLSHQPLNLIASAACAYPTPAHNTSLEPTPPQPTTPLTTSPRALRYPTTTQSNPLNMTASSSTIPHTALPSLTPHRRVPGPLRLWCGPDPAAGGRHLWPDVRRVRRCLRRHVLLLGVGCGRGQAGRRGLGGLSHSSSGCPGRVVLASGVTSPCICRMLMGNPFWFLKARHPIWGAAF